MRILLTGITGLLGTRLAARLLDGGDEVVAVTRRPEAVPARAGLTVVDGDPTCPGPWQYRVAGCDAVVHLACAGRDPAALTGAGLADLRERRLDSLFQVMMAMESAPGSPRRLVLLTNRLALGAHPDGLPGALASLARTHEAQALRHAETSGLSVLLLRAGLVIDERAGVPAIPSEVDGARGLAWIHADDLVVALANAVRSDRTGVLDAVAPERPVLADLRARQGDVDGRPPTGETLALLGWPTRPESEPTIEVLGVAFRHERLDVAKSPPAPVRDSRPDAAGASSGPAEHGPGHGRGRLVVLPAEGLLIEGDRPVAGALELLERLDSCGLRVVLATSRGGRAALELADSLSVRTPVIAADGAAILDPLRREVVRTEVLAAEQVAAIAMAVRTTASDALLVVERGLQAFTDGGRPLPDSLSPLVEIDDRVDTAALLARPATRLLVHAPPRRLRRALEVVRDTWWRERRIAMNDHGPDLVAMTAPTADRGVALQRLELGMDVPRRSSLVVAADARDRGMLEFAGIGFRLPLFPDTDPTGRVRTLASGEPGLVAETLVRAHLEAGMRATTPRA